MNEELALRESLGIDLDLPFLWENKEETETTKQGEPQPLPTLPSFHMPKQVAVQGRFLNLNQILPGQHLPLWWEDKRVQQQIQQNPKYYPNPPF